ncbi:hypothetical protein ERJ75_000054600 [Trypanosoma vivax]|uniref:Uncharacterized protein n=1 Tax=Trypanosoma vivax (strain Y486) TaxID=1055687 RepID=G0TZ95_TRYVY|nr:hypothetical protein ERJ75_000054600 [Trypanosoma vivax]CCC49298.1 conserved hypothetical protein [Trypanosoma vivax Y486]
MSATTSTHSSTSLASEGSTPPVTSVRTGGGAIPVSAAAPGHDHAPVASKASAQAANVASARLEDGSYAAAATSVVNSVRETPEYRVAWDLELWRAVQAAQLKQQLAEQKKKALAELARSVKAREQQAVACLELRERDIGRREQRLVEAEKQLEKRQWRLAEMERDLRRVRQQLTDARRRAKEEAAAEAQRAKDDAMHAVELSEQRVQAAEAQAKRADDRLQQAQRDYLALSDEFHRFRTRELTTPPEKLSAVEGRLRTQFIAEQEALRKQLELRHVEQQQELSDRCRKLEEENKHLTALATKRKEQLRRSTSDVEHLRQLNKVLDERVQQLEAAAGKAFGQARATAAGSSGSAAALPASAMAGAGAASAIAREVDRLRRERRFIVEGSGGALDENSDVVRALDKAINDMVEQLNCLGPHLHMATD